MLAQSMTPVLVAAESVLLAFRLLLRRLPSVSRCMSTGAPARNVTQQFWHQRVRRYDEHLMPVAP